MSWLSPRRRRTTGNLKTISNGQVTHVIKSDAPNSPTIDEVALNGSRSSSTEHPPSIPERASSLAERPTSNPDRPPSIPRAISQPAVPIATSADGNLFYAYARKSDEQKSRYLLTFASAATANEWWLLLQTNFPDVSRPGAQLFSFKTDDLLSIAWRHPAFAHLKSKWMYISFSDARSDELGGAAGGIIPVQDAHGNMLGGSAPASPNRFAREVQAEARSVKTEVQKLEEHFERMMKAVERNTEKVADLANEKRKQRTSHDETLDALSTMSGGTENGSGVVDMGVLAGHFVRMNDLLSKNTANVEALAKKHYENEEKLSRTLESLVEKKNVEQSDESPALDRLTSHLDRIQKMMETSFTERNDSAKDLTVQQPQPVQIDFSPLTERLGKVQEAVEQNSTLVKALLDEGGDSKPTTPFWGKTDSTGPDLLPLTQHLQRIHEAIQQQGEHMKALVGFANPEENDREARQVPAEVSLEPLSEHLEQIYNAIEEGNKRSRVAPKLDLEPLSSHLEALHNHSQANMDNMNRLIESQDATREAIEANSSNKANADSMQRLIDVQEATRKAIEASGSNQQPATKLDLSPLTSHLEALHSHSQANVDTMNRLIDSQDATRKAIEANSSSQANVDSMQRLINAQEATHKAIEANRDNKPPTITPKLDLGPLSSHLEALHTHSQANVDTMNRLIDSQDATRKAIEANGNNTANADGMQRLIDAQEATRKAIESSRDNKQPTVTPKLDLDPLNKHFQALRNHAKTNSDNMGKLLEAQKTIRDAVEANGGEIDFTPMTEYLEAIRESSDTHTETVRELLASQEATRKESNFDMTPLVDHLSAVRDATDKNSTHIKSLVDSHREAAKSPQTPAIDLTPMTDRLNRIHAVLEKQTSSRNQTNGEGTGDPKFILNALTSHLSKIQSVTETNATHVKALREKHSATSDVMSIAVTETSQQVRALIQRNKDNQTTIDAQNAQMRELMSGQREMVDVMRQLAKSVVAMTKPACDHVVVPPPRKMGRKIVGFVYDAKEGQYDDGPATSQKGNGNGNGNGGGNGNGSGSGKPKRPGGMERSFTSAY